METLKVMIVDDEVGMRAGVQRALEDYRFSLPEVGCDIAFTIEQVETGEDALQLVAAEAPAILLLDHKLPGMTGMEVLEQMPASAADTLTIMITAYASIETALKATRQGAYDFLPKPFTPAELKYSVRKAAGRVVLARRAKALAEEKKRIRFEFIRVLGHELKAPLGAVESYMDLIRSRTMGESLEAYDKPIERSQIRLGQMRKLISDLLDLTRIESGQRQREFTQVDLTDVASQAIELMETPAAERKITIQLHAPAPVMMRGDRSELEIILNNLVSNAIKYNRDGGRVDVTLKGQDGQVTIAIADTGIGMTTGEAAKLFGEFVRIRNNKTRNILGSGLGLSIVQKLAHLYGGSASVETAPDVGSTFTVTLRSAESHEAEDAAPEEK